MTEDYFWGVSLSSSMKELKWEPDALKENGGAGDMSLTSKGEHALILKQAMLSADAKDGEVNVVQVETSGFKTNSLKIPIVTLVGGKSNHVLLDLNFPDPPVTLKLIEGSGPVHIAGNHIINAEQYNDEDDDDEDDDLEDFDENVEEDDEEEEESLEKKKEEKGGKKRTNSGSAPNQPKKKKKSGKDD